MNTHSLLFRLWFGCLVFLSPTPLFAWNALGHKVIADIAWRELNEDQRTKIVDTLKRHPRFAEDFARDMPSEDTDHWIFLHAATWPDIARGIKGPDRDKFDKPIWHYVNHPLTIDGFMAPLLNLSTDPKDKGAKTISWNVGQATNFCISMIESDAPPQQKALAYSWILHLVGDMHQPMHSTALFSERFPKGDRGGNSIKTVQGRNLHSLWDNLLGRSHKPNDVRREVSDLTLSRQLFTEVDTHTDIDAWIVESHQIAKDFAYHQSIVDGVQQKGDIPPFNLPGTYLTDAGSIARQRVVAAGLRLAVILGDKPQKNSRELAKQIAEESDAARLRTQKFLERFAGDEPTPTSRVKTQVKDYWLNTESGVRHNSGCRHYGKTESGRYCSGSEGKACGICGG